MRKIGFGIAMALAVGTAGAAVAERIEAGFQTLGVTLYPDRAEVSRRIAFEAEAGRHELVVAGLPPGTRAETLRMDLPDGVSLSSTLVTDGRLPVTEARTPPEVAEAEAEVERIAREIEAARADIAEILLARAAAEEQLRFLRGLGNGVPLEAVTPERLADIRALAALVGDIALEAQTAAHAADRAAAEAEREVDALQEALAEAEQALAALVVEREGQVTLTLELEVAAAGTFEIGLSSLTQDAYWAPVYDLSLDTGTGALLLERGVVVGQSSGEDWRGVTLTLSTARPGEQSAPGEVWPTRRRILSHEEIARRAAIAEGGVGGFATDIVEPPLAVMADAAAQVDYQGMTVSYVYPEAVDLRDGVDSLRLDLGEMTFAADVVAEAVPIRDDTAFLMAEFVNSSGEVLLPGSVRLVRDGALIGGATLPLTPAGGELRLGFGPIDGLRLRRDVIAQSEGEVGVITSANRRVRTVLMQVENLTGRPWDVTLRDGLSYSEQDDLVVTWAAEPEITRIAPDNRRGVVEWDLRVEAGETADVEVEETLDWPEGYDLQ